MLPDPCRCSDDLSYVCETHASLSWYAFRVLEKWRADYALLAVDVQAAYAHCNTTYTKMWAAMSGQGITATAHSLPPLPGNEKDT